ncbi:hypothetical protein FHY03_001001 [Sphingomonas sp. BK345]|nr:hypothetical protein [Sphingomonas sp. BK345]MBB3472741.1 hypothetical protein [Sphingomonas sp. BK345]
MDRASDAEVVEAAAHGVTLIPVDGAALLHYATAGRRAVSALQAGGLDGAIDLWVGHDVKTGFAASAAAAELGGKAALVHHMDYESYRNLWGCRGQDTAARSESRYERPCGAGGPPRSQLGARMTGACPFADLKRAPMSYRAIG